MRHCCWYQTGCSKYFTDGCQWWCRCTDVEVSLGKTWNPEFLWAWQRLAGQQPPSEMWAGEWEALVKRFWHHEAEEKVQLIYHLPQPSQGFTENRAQKRKYPVRGSCVLISRVRLDGDYWLQTWRVGSLPGHTTLTTLKTWKHPHWPLYWVHAVLTRWVTISRRVILKTYSYISIVS